MNNIHTSTFKTLSLIALLLLSPIIFLFYDGFFSSQTPKEASYGIIYGNTVFPDGTPSPRLVARLEAGKKLYDNGRIKTLIVSGAVGKEWHDEAEVMRDFLVRNWVPTESIIVDNDGYTTRHTSENAFKIVSEREKDMRNISVIGISQWFHISRVKLSLKQAWFKNVSGFAPFYFEARDIYSLVREIPAYMKYLIKY